MTLYLNECAIVCALGDSHGEVRRRLFAGESGIAPTDAWSKVGYVLHTLPETQPVFDVIQRGGQIADEEMFLVFNMGIGFGIVVAAADADAVCHIGRKHGFDSLILGHATTADPGRVLVAPRRLVGEDDHFRRI